MAKTIIRMFYFILIMNMIYSVNSQTESRIQYPTCSEYQVETWREPFGQIHYDNRHSDINFCFNITLSYRATITISFKEFNFGYKYDLLGCNNFVAIGSSDPQLSKQYCGNNLPPSYSVDSDHAWVWMHRNIHNIYIPADVIFSYRAEPNFVENIVIPRPGYALITSPNFPHYAPLNSHCGWSISHESESRLPLQVEFFNWNVSFLTQVKIYDGKDAGFPILAIYDARSTPGIGITAVTTTGPYAYIEFTTSEYVSESLFNLTVKIKGYCLPGTYSCNDGATCYKASQKCNVYRDCDNGFDELGCRGCTIHEYLCGLVESDCYTDDQHCNGMKDCSSSIKTTNGLSLPADELNCKSCGPGAFFCPGDQRCIYERWRCDGDKDCQDNSDEEGCHYVASRRVITASAIGSLVCGLLLVIALGCTCKLYSMRSAHHGNPHHISRATPLTRVERELFRRQAPPSYDMTVEGVGADQTLPASTRSQRQRRHRNRRYQFQRSMPASSTSSEQPSNGRSDSIETAVQSTNTLPPASVPSQSSQPIDPAITREARQNMASIVFESVPNIIAEMFFNSRQQQQMAQGAAATGVPSTSSVETRDSGTQTNMHGQVNNLQSGAGTLRGISRTQSSTGQDGRRRSGRGSSRSRSRNRRSRNSKEQQAKPLPKKKKILPVMVSAPCLDEVVEDTLTCVYPSPPSYSQAVASDSPSHIVTDPVHIDSNTSFESYSEEQEVGLAPTACAMSPKSVSVTRSKVSFPFSIGKAIRSLASPSKSGRNAYVRMRNEDAVSDEVPNEVANTSSSQMSTYVVSHHNVPRQNRPSETSSDEDLLDITLGESNTIQIVRSSFLKKNSDEHKPTSTVTLKPVASPDDSIVTSSLHLQNADSLELTHFSLEEEV